MTESQNESISFVGGGNMARSIIGGLIGSQWSPEQIHVSDPSREQRELLEDSFGVHCYEDNVECVIQSRIIILSVKPQIMKQAIESIKQPLQKTKPLVISIAAGIRISDILSWADTDLPFIRVMPNTPALVNAGISGMMANELVSENQKLISENVLKAVGDVVWVESERDIDTVTGISGSGPAYYFKMMEVMIATAQKHGLSEQQSKSLVLNTALGAAKLALDSEFDPRELRKQVTSPGGTTQAGITTMEENGIDMTIERGVDAAIARSDELANTLGES